MNLQRLARLTWPHVVAIALVASLFQSSAFAVQRREHLTSQEIDMVRDAQELDRRTAIFIKAAERRMLLLSDPQAPVSKHSQKDFSNMGEIPQSTRAQLFSDLAGILDEAIDNIDNAQEHNVQSSLIPKAVKNLTEASKRFLAQLMPLREKTEGGERELLEQVIDNLNQIIEASKKLPAEKSAKP